MLNKLKHELCSFTSLALISERKLYNINPPSCEAWQNMAMICGQKTSLPSCVARQMAMICNCKTNLSNCHSDHLILSSGDNTLQPICDAQLSSAKADKVISNKIGAVFKSGNLMNGKFSTESHTRPSCEASINYSFDCGNINSIVAWPAHIENSDMVVKHFDKVQSVIETNQKRKRDREPSRIPVRKVLKLLKRKISRHRVKNLLRKSVPNFHESNKFSIKQCIVCLEAWPLRCSSDTDRTFQFRCLRCIRDKKRPQKFSNENNMIPSPVPCELQGLTQVEEMLTSRALPIMTVYIQVDLFLEK